MCVLLLGCTDDEMLVEISTGQIILFDDGLPHNAQDECINAEYHKHGHQSAAISAAPSLVHMQK